MILRIELRRSIAVWAGMAVVGVALGFLFLFTGPWWKVPAPWTAHSTTAALWVRFVLIFLWPVVVGAGAIQGMRDSRSGVTELLTTASRPGWHRAAKLAGAVGALCGLGYLLVFAAGLVEVLAHDGFVSPGFLPVTAVGLLGIVAGSWVGLAVGRLVPHPLAAPAAAVLTLAASILCWLSLDPDLNPVLPVRAGPLTPSLPEPRGMLVTTAASLDVGQAVWFLGLAITGFLLLAVDSVRARLLSLLPLVAGLAIALPLFPATPAAAYTQDTFATGPVCDGPVCIDEIHRDRLAALAGPGREALALLAKLPGAPTRVEERAEPGLGRPPRDPGVVYLNLQNNTRLLTADAADLRQELVSGAGVPSCERPTGGSEADETSRVVAAAYFTGELRPLLEYGSSRSPSALTEQVWAKFRALPADVRFERIAALRQALLACQGNKLGILLPGEF